MSCRSLLMLALAAALVPAVVAHGEHVTVTLVGGARISATLLRENDEGVVLDLGYDVLHIPAKQVLLVDRGQAEDTAESARDRGIYSTGRLQPAEVPQLVKRFGDAVVVVRTAGGLGSGFITSRQGHLITNYHVVEQQTRITVTLYRRAEQGYEKHDLKRVRILALHPLRDIALLQLDLGELPGALPEPVVLNDQDDVRVGDLVFAIGNPLGLERTVTQGIVSSTTRTIGHLRLIQTDASINPGNSGGPLFNARGEVVGIVCAGHVTFDGLAFGIPARDLIDFLEHRDSYLYDPTQPQNGVSYLDPPYRAEPVSEASTAEPPVADANSMPDVEETSP